LSLLGFLLGMTSAQWTLATSDEASASPDTGAAKAAPAALTGSQVYNAVCIACHAPPGLGGAPALGSREAWAPRLARGLDSLIDHALNGFSGSAGIMPRKGGRLDLSDAEIVGAVKYMVEQAGL